MQSPVYPLQVSLSFHRVSENSMSYHFTSLESGDKAGIITGLPFGLSGDQFAGLNGLLPDTSSTGAGLVSGSPPSIPVPGNGEGVLSGIASSLGSGADSSGALSSIISPTGLGGPSGPLPDLTDGLESGSKTDNILGSLLPAGIPSAASSGGSLSDLTGSLDGSSNDNILGSLPFPGIPSSDSGSSGALPSLISPLAGGLDRASGPLPDLDSGFGGSSNDNFLGSLPLAGIPSSLQPGSGSRGALPSIVSPIADGLDGASGSLPDLTGSLGSGSNNPLGSLPIGSIPSSLPSESAPSGTLPDIVSPLAGGLGGLSGSLSNLASSFGSGSDNLLGSLPLVGAPLSLLPGSASSGTLPDIVTPLATGLGGPSGSLSDLAGSLGGGLNNIPGSLPLANIPSAISSGSISSGTLPNIVLPIAGGLTGASGSLPDLTGGLSSGTDNPLGSLPLVGTPSSSPSGSAPSDTLPDIIAPLAGGLSGASGSLPDLTGDLGSAPDNPLGSLPLVGIPSSSSGSTGTLPDVVSPLAGGLGGASGSLPDLTGSLGSEPNNPLGSLPLVGIPSPASRSSGTLPDLLPPIAGGLDRSSGPLPDLNHSPTTGSNNGLGELPLTGVPSSLPPGGDPAGQFPNILSPISGGLTGAGTSLPDLTDTLGGGSNNIGSGRYASVAGLPLSFGADHGNALPSGDSSPTSALSALVGAGSDSSLLPGVPLPLTRNDNSDSLPSLLTPSASPSDGGGTAASLPLGFPLPVGGSFPDENGALTSSPLPLRDDSRYVPLDNLSIANANSADNGLLYFLPLSTSGDINKNTGLSGLSLPIIGDRTGNVSGSPLSNVLAPPGSSSSIPPLPITSSQGSPLGLPPISNSGSNSPLSSVPTSLGQGTMAPVDGIPDLVSAVDDGFKVPSANVLSPEIHSNGDDGGPSGALPSTLDSSHINPQSSPPPPPNGASDPSLLTLPIPDLSKPPLSIPSLTDNGGSSQPLPGLSIPAVSTFERSQNAPADSSSRSTPILHGLLG